MSERETKTETKATTKLIDGYEVRTDRFGTDGTGLIVTPPPPGDKTEETYRDHKFPTGD